MGKTMTRPLTMQTTRKHPHVHGEDARYVTKKVNGQETPPRAWGRLQQAKSGFLCAGNTPTCMGKTRINCKADVTLGKHPHVHGEDCSYLFGG